MSTIEKINLKDKLALFSDHWSPKIVGQVNDFHVKLVKIRGEFLWHHHDDEDELFYVIRGRLKMRFRDRDVVVEPGEFIIVPRGVEHLPVADEEVHLMLIEPASTRNTGNVDNERTVAEPERI